MLFLLYTYRSYLPIEHVTNTCPYFRGEDEERTEIHLEMGPHWQLLDVTLLLLLLLLALLLLLVLLVALLLGLLQPTHR